MSPPTLHDVGLACALSPSTVSLALRGDGRIARKTRERVQEMARQIGYRPNAAAAALAAGRHNKPMANRVIVVVTCLSRADALTGLRVFGPQKILAQAELRGYSAHQVEMSLVSDVPKAIRQMYHEGVDGVILDDVRVSDLDLFQFDWSAFAVTVHRRTHYTRGFDLVTPDPFHSVRALWDEMRKRGYRRIGVLLCRHEPMMIDDEIREGALAFCQSQLSSEETALPPYLGPHADAKAILEWMGQHKPDAVVGFTDMHYWQLREMVEIPGKVAYASLHSELGDPAIAGMCEEDDVLAGMCVEHLDQLIRHRRLGRPEHPRQILLNNLWKPGASLPN